jgi:hypothetical protein
VVPMALDLDLDNTSRVELEHVLARCVALGHGDDAAAIRAELAGRVWQNHNPYAPVVEVAA